MFSDKSDSDLLEFIRNLQIDLSYKEYSAADIDAMLKDTITFYKSNKDKTVAMELVFLINNCLMHVEKPKMADYFQLFDLQNYSFENAQLVLQSNHLYQSLYEESYSPFHDYLRNLYNFVTKSNLEGETIQVNNNEYTHKEAIKTIYELFGLIKITSEEFLKLIPIIFTKEYLPPENLFRLAFEDEDIARIADKLPKFIHKKSNLISKLPDKALITIIRANNTQENIDLLNALTGTNVSQKVLIEFILNLKKTDIPHNAAQYLFSSLNIAEFTPEVCEALLDYPVDFIVKEGMQINYSIHPLFFITHIDQPLQHMPIDIINDLITNCDKPEKLHPALTSDLVCQALKGTDFWLKFIPSCKILSVTNFFSPVQSCFINNQEPDTLASVIVDLIKKSGENMDQICKFVKNVVSMSQDVLNKPDLIEYAVSLTSQPPVSFWTIFQHPEKFLKEVLDDENRRSQLPFFICTCLPVFAYYMDTAKPYVLRINDLTENDTKSVIKYISTKHNGMTQLLEPIEGISENSLRLILSAQYFTTVNLNPTIQFNSKFIGINPTNILPFIAVCFKVTREHSYVRLFKQVNIFNSLLKYKLCHRNLSEWLSEINSLSELDLISLQRIFAYALNINGLTPKSIVDFEEYFLRFIDFNEIQNNEQLVLTILQHLSHISATENEDLVKLLSKKAERILEIAFNYSKSHQYNSDLRIKKNFFSKEILNNFVSKISKSDIIYFLRIFDSQKFDLSVLTIPDEDVKTILQDAIKNKNEDDVNSIFKYIEVSKKPLQPFYDSGLPNTIKFRYLEQAQLSDLENMDLNELVQIFENFTSSQLLSQIKTVKPKRKMASDLLDNEQVNEEEEEQEENKEKTKYNLFEVVEKLIPTTKLFSIVKYFDMISDIFCTSSDVLSMAIKDMKFDVETGSQAIDIYYAHEVTDMLIRRSTPLKLPDNTEFSKRFLENLIEKACKSRSLPLIYLLDQLAYKNPKIFTELKPSITEICSQIFDLTDELPKLFTGDLSEEESSIIAFSFQTFISLSALPSFNDEFLIPLIEKLPELSIGKLLTILFLLKAQMYSPLQIIALSILCKYQFPSLFVQILSKPYENDKIKDIIFRTTYGLASNYFTCICSLKENSAVILDELMNNMEKPYTESFPGQVVLFYNRIVSKACDTLFSYIPNKKTVEFLSDILDDSPKKPISNKLKVAIAIDQAKKFPGEPICVPPGVSEEAFLNLTRRQQSRVWHSLYPKTIKEITPKMRRVLARKPSWVVNFLTKPPGMLLTPSHYKMLFEIINELLVIEQQQEEEEATPEMVKMMLLMVPDLFDFLMADIKNPNSSKYAKDIIELMTALSKDEMTAVSILPLIASEINECGQTDLTKFVKILKYMNTTEYFPINFRDIVCEILIDRLLQPEIRENDDVLLRCFRTLQILPNDITENLVPKLSLLLNFTLSKSSSESDICFSSLQIASKSEAIIEKVSPVIMTTIDKILSKKGNFQNWTDYLITVINKFKFIVAKKRPQLLSLLQSILKDTEKRDNCLDLMGSLFDCLSPEKVTQSSTFETPKEGLEIPPQIYNSDPEFWSIINEHKDYLNELIAKTPKLLDTKLKFLMRFPQLLAFDQKVACFRNELKKRRTGGSLRINVRRDDVLQDSFQQLAMIPPDRMLSRLHVMFRGEEGYDAGGVTRDWFTSVIHQLFNPNYVLFAPSANGRSFQPNPASNINYMEHKQYFKFAGRIMAKAIIEEQYLDAHLTMSILKAILGIPVTLRDLEDVDEQLHNSLQWILENDIEDACLDLNFTYNYDYLGRVKAANLKFDGAKIAVDNSNKEEYVNLMVQYRLRGQISTQVDSFLEGFHSLIPQKDLSMFSPNELDLLICGVPEVDVDDMEKNCVITRPLTKDSDVVKFFFSAIRKWSSEDLAKLLLFITGSSQIPIGGFATLKDSHPITIQPGGDSDRLPVAHTCMNTLDLPYYKTEDELNRKLQFAIKECNTFGII